MVRGARSGVVESERETANGDAEPEKEETASAHSSNSLLGIQKEKHLLLLTGAT